MIKWIKHKIKVHEYKGMLKELETLGIKSKKLKEAYFATEWTDRGLSKHAKEKLIEEYTRIGNKYKEYVDVLISVGLYAELEKIHMQVLNTQYMPNDITRTIQEDLDWDK